MKIVAALMVKNEEKIIERCLKSVCPIVDAVAVLDTGSTDKTLKLIETQWGKSESYIKKSDWKGFGASRTELIEHTREEYPDSWILLIDADYELQTDIKSPDELRSKLDESVDAYYLTWAGSLTYSNRKILNGKHEWVYVGRTHEYIELKKRPQNFKSFTEIKIKENYDGSNRPEKFKNDLKLLTEDIDDPLVADKSRSYFYRGRTYFDLGQYKEAIADLEISAGMPSWNQQRYVAMLQVGRALKNLGKNPLSALFEAFLIDKNRWEAPAEIVSWFNSKELWSLSRAFFESFSRQAGQQEEPALFIEQDATWRIADGAALACWKLGNKVRAKNLWTLAGSSPYCDAENGMRIASNISLWCN